MSDTATRSVRWSTQETERVYNWISTRPSRIGRWKRIAQMAIDSWLSHQTAIECVACSLRESIEVDYDDDEIAEMFGNLAKVDWAALAVGEIEDTESPHRD